MEDQWTRSNCPICGRSFPHEVSYRPVTCGRVDCLLEANRRGLPDNPVKAILCTESQRLEATVLVAKAAEAELLKCIREDAKIADNMRDFWKHQAGGAEDV